jgi:transposase
MPTTRETSQFADAFNALRKKGDLNRVYRKVAKSIGIDPGQVQELISMKAPVHRKSPGKLRRDASKAEVSALPTKPYSSFQAALKKAI